MDHGGGGTSSATIESDVPAGRLNTQQLLMLEDDTKVIEEREKEIQHVVQSIVELNTIFKDLAVMVSEQVRQNMTKHLAVVINGYTDGNGRLSRIT